MLHIMNAFLKNVQFYRKITEKLSTCINKFSVQPTQSCFQVFVGSWHNLFRKQTDIQNQKLGNLTLYQ